MPSPHDSLRWRLREATAAAHARIDARVGNAFDDVGGYAAFLRAMHRFVRHARDVLADAPDLDECETALAADLDVLGCRPLEAAPIEADRRADARLGWRYVIAGSSLGARVLQRRALALGFDHAHGARYLALHAKGEAWTSLLGTLDALRLPADGERSACAGANAAFDCVEHCLDAARREAA
jgi:heme oxygenase